MKKNVTLTVLALFGLSTCFFADAYGACPYAGSYAKPAKYTSPNYAGSYAKPAKYTFPAYNPKTADATASAITDIAAAKASAAKIDGVNYHALDSYGHQIGVPLLVKPYGPLTGLYSALGPDRSFVGTIAAGFYKDDYGNIKFRDESSIGAIVLT